MEGRLRGGGGGFFPATSSRQLAIRRLLRYRCNVLLCIRPDEERPVFPVRMQLKDDDADDVLFPSCTPLFHVRAAKRVLSSELGELGAGAEGGTSSAAAPWPITVLEVRSQDRSLDALAHLHQAAEPGGIPLRAGAGPLSPVQAPLGGAPPPPSVFSVLQARREAARAAAASDAEAGPQRPVEAEAEELLRFAEMFQNLDREGAKPPAPALASASPVRSYLDESIACLEEAEALTAEFGSAVQGRALLSLARFQIQKPDAGAGKKASSAGKFANRAAEVLTKALGSADPEAKSAKAEAQALLQKING